MKKADMKSAASYLDSIGSGFESKTVTEGKPQDGKAHEEEVAKSNNWKGDKRDSIGRAAALKITRKLRRIASEIEAYAEEYMDDEYAEDIEKVEKDMKDEIEEDEMDKEARTVRGESWDEIAPKFAAHITVTEKDNPDGEMSVRTGDEWIDVTTEDWKNDKRDKVGKPE